MTPKGLAGHLRKKHKMNTLQNVNLPRCSAKTFADYLRDQHKSGERHDFRQPGKCMHPACVDKEFLYIRIDKHIKDFHELTSSQYDTILKM